MLTFVGALERGSCRWLAAVAVRCSCCMVLAIEIICRLGLGGRVRRGLSGSSGEARRC